MFFLTHYKTSLPNAWIPLDPNFCRSNLNSLHARLVALGPEDTEDLVGPQKTNDLRPVKWAMKQKNSGCLG